MLNFTYHQSMIGVGFTSSYAQTTTVKAPRPPTEVLKTDAVDDSANLMATITMAIISYLAAKLYSAKMTLDIGLAAAGGALFIISDKMAILKDKNTIIDLQTVILRDEKGRVDETQIAILEKLKKSYETAKETSETKKMLQMAAAGAFAAAAAAAYFMAGAETAAEAACLVALKSALGTALGGVESTCASLALNPITLPEAGICKAELATCTTKITGDMEVVETFLATRESPGISMQQLPADTAQAQLIVETFALTPAACTGFSAPMLIAENAGACATAMAPLIMAQNSGSAIPPAATDLTNIGTGASGSFQAPGVAPEPVNEYHPGNDGSAIPIQKLLYPPQKLQLETPKYFSPKNYFETILNAFFPAAHAGMLDSAMGFITSSFKSLGTFIDQSLLMPKRRAIIWGALAGLAYMASSALDSELEKIKENIKKIDDIINSMRMTGDGTVAEAVATVPGTPALPATSNPGPGTPTTTKPTITGTSGTKSTLKGIKATTGIGGTGVNISSPCFTGGTAANCPPFNPNTSSITSSTLQAQIASVTAAANGINGTRGLTAGSLRNLRTLANSRRAINEEMLKHQAAFQQKLKDAGSKTDLAAESNKMKNDLIGIVQKEMDAKNLKPAEVLASLSNRTFKDDPNGGKGSGASANDANSIVKFGAKKAFGAAHARGAGATGVNGKIGAAGDSSENFLDKNSDEEKAAAVVQEYEVNDITKDKSTSIFEVISNRYRKSYNRLFEKK